MPARVPDASVIAAFAFDEPRANEASGLISGMDLYAPRLLAYELANIAWKKARLYADGVDGLTADLEDVLDLDWHWVEVNHAATLRLALETDLTAYDASYLYVARTLGIPLVTFDSQLRRARRNIR